MYYARVGMLAMAIHVIINLKTLISRDRMENTLEKKRYRLFLYSVMLYYITDILWGTLYDAKLLVAVYIDTVVYFFSMVLSVLLWTRYVVAYLKHRGSFSKFLIYGGWIILIYEVIVLIINFFVPFAFYFNEDKVYQPGQARYITLIIQMTLYFITACYTFIKVPMVKGVAKLQYAAVGASGLIMTAFIGLQCLYPLQPFYAMGCMLATCMIHSFVYMDETSAYAQEIESNRQIAYRDALTGVKSKHAYNDAVERVNKRVEGGELSSYGVVVFDLNGLKAINDTKGHEAGDEYLKVACRMICVAFKHSPVFRIGGDEFVAILEGDDYENRERLLKEFNNAVEDRNNNETVSVSGGLAVYSPDFDKDFGDVFKRADKKMYERKRQLKAAL